MKAGSLRQIVRPRAYLAGGNLRFIDLACLRHSHRYRERQTIEAYQRLIQHVLDVKSAFAYAAGRHALVEILKALDIGHGDEVIVPGYTCIVVPAAVQAVGAVPVYADIDTATLNTPAAAIKALISNRTRAVLAQHTFGIPCDIEEIQEIARRSGIHLVEDAAHALGARVGSVACGNYGSAAFFSTEASKMISTVKGGLVTTNVDWVAERLSRSYPVLPIRPDGYTVGARAWWWRQLLQNDPRFGSLARRLMTTLSGASQHTQFLRMNEDEYTEALAGRVSAPARLSAGLASLAMGQVRRLNVEVRQRNVAARRLRHAAVRLGWRVPAFDQTRVTPSFVRFPVLVDDPGKWIVALHSVGIEAGRWLDHPLHPAGSQFERCGYKHGICPNAELVSSHIVNIPLNGRCAHWISNRIGSLAMPAS